jgi:N12 class adenine-specific DNA methylase
MLEQYTAEFVRLYPCAAVLMATKDDLAGDRRREFVSRIATGDWDAIVMTHSTFELLGMSVAYTTRHIKAIIHDLEMAVRMSRSDDRSNRIVKQLERMKKAWKVRLDRLANEKKRDDFLSWESLGIDWVLYDEAHLAKNLWRHTKMARIAGLPLANSQRAFDLYLKTRHTMSLYRGQHRGVVLSTATPVANSMAEIHTFQRYLQPNTLEALGLEQFDAWAATFRRDRHGARDRTRRQRLPPEHAVRAVHQRAGPDGRVLRAGRHPHEGDAEPAGAGPEGPEAPDGDLPAEQRAQGVRAIAGAPGGAAQDRPHRSAGGQHAEHHQ